MVFERRTLLHFDATGVAVAGVVHAPRAPRVRAEAEAPLQPGALVPSPIEENLQRPDEIRAALAQALQALGRNGRGATLVLPDGLARPALIEPPRGVDAREFARFRLAPGLPFSASEAIVDGLRAGEGRFLAAAARRRVLRSYELLVESLGLSVERVGFAGLVAVAGFLSGNAREARLLAVLGDAAVSLAALRGRELLTFRTRLREAGPGEPVRLRDEILRTALAGGVEDVAQVCVVGKGARAMAGSLAGLGLPARAGWADGDVEGAESLWPGAAVA